MSKLTTSPLLPEARLLELARLRSLSNLWDRAFSVPGTRWRVGLESLVGLLPIGGDVFGLGVSVYILWHVVQFDLPKTVVLRMVFNIAIDAVVGSVPLMGDLFDTTWKANTKNVNLLEAHLREPSVSKRADRRFLWLLFGGLLLVWAALVLLGIGLLMLILSLLKLKGY